MTLFTGKTLGEMTVDELLDSAYTELRNTEQLIDLTTERKVDGRRFIAGLNEDDPPMDLVQIALTMVAAKIVVAQTKIREAITLTTALPNFVCEAKIWHGPGHQSGTRCERTDPHDLDDVHYAINPMEPGFEWTGAKAYV